MPNGIVTYASRLVPALRQLGHEVFVLTPNPRTDATDPYTVGLKQYVAKPVLLERMAWRFKPDLAAFRFRAIAVLRAIQDLVEKRGVQVLEIEDTQGWSAVISQQRILPLVVRLHGPWFLTGRFESGLHSRRTAAARIRKEGEALCAATAVTAPSQSVLGSTEKQYGVELKLKKVIPNPIGVVDDGACWHAQTADRSRILFVGRFDRIKGADVVLEAFKLIATRHPEVHLSFVGPDSGLAHGGSVVKTFREYVANSLPGTIRERIDYLGVLGYSALQRLRTQCFVTIVASRFETFSNTVQEAMAVGCPLVATAVGGIPELVESERNGLLVAPEEPAAMAAACERFLFDVDLARRLGSQARADCIVRCDPERIARETMSLYEAAIAAFRDSVVAWR